MQSRFNSPSRPDVNGLKQARRNWILSLLCSAMTAAFVCLANSALAHDPYEITSTVNLEVNQINLQVEMEFPAAMSLVEANQSSSTAVPPEEKFADYLPQLKQQAGRFMEIQAAGEPLRAVGTNVTLELENHVFFRLVFPSTELRPLQFSVPGLQTLSEHGPFGTTLTVLDRVHQKVLGQKVLFADSGAVEFKREPTVEAAPTPAELEVPASTPQIVADHGDVIPVEPLGRRVDRVGKSGFWPALWVGLLAILIVTILRSYTRTRRE